MKAQNSYQSTLFSQIAQYVLNRINRKWILWLAGLLFTAGTGFALYQPVHPDPWHMHTGWDSFIYPQETNAFLRQASISQAINDVVSIGEQLWAVGDGGLILHSSNGGQCWVTQGPWVQTEGLNTCPQEQTGVQRIFSGLSAQLENKHLLDTLISPAYAEKAPAPTSILDQNVQQSFDYKKEPQQIDLKTQLENLKARTSNRARALCGGLNQRPCSLKERSLPCDAGLVSDNTGTQCIRPAQTQPDNFDLLASGVTPNLRAVAFFNQSKGIAVGDYGAILLTDDSGKSWHPVSSITTSTLYSIVIPDQQSVIVGGSKGTLLRSTDQGTSWKSISSNSTDNIESFISTADKQLFALAVNHLRKSSTILQSSNAGASWRAARRPMNLAIRDIVTLDSNRWVTITDNGDILDSTDSGNTWKRRHHENGASLHSIVKLNDKQLIATGGNGSILRSSDNGESWNRVDSGTSAILTSLVILDNNRLVVVGSSGTILTSANQGQSWTSITRGTRGELSAIASQDSKHVMTVGRDGVILYSSDGGLNWKSAKQADGSQLLSITATSNGSYLAVGDKGGIRNLNAMGKSSQSISGNVDVRLFSVNRVGKNRYLAVGDSGTILSSDDRGSHWNKIDSGVKTSLQAITTLDNNRVIAVGQEGSVMLSDDRGSSWRRADINRKEWLLSVANIDNNSLIATGYNGLILRSDDAGLKWRMLASRVNNRLNSVIVVSSNQFITVGTGGTILRTEDAGDSWVSIPSGTTNNLNSITRLTNHQLLIAGSGGMLLRSIDDGRSWIAINNYSVTLAYWWYLLVLISIGLVLFVVWPRIEATEDEGIAGLAASDRPLQPGDPDALNLTGIASDITTFLSNPKTTAPLTMAITGPWGSGKSSLMNLVRADLKARGFSPVWFNAWHHQKGEQLLASLFSHIRQQAIPSWFSFDGLWFRLKLAFIRGRRHWFIFAIMLALLFLTLSFNKQEISATLLKLSLLSDPRMWWQIPWQEWTPNMLTLSSGGDWIQTLASIFGIGTPLLALLKSIRGFGINPKRLVSIDQSRDSKGGYDPGARARFASEFRDVTQALGNNKMVIFIDDLDRCSQANLIDILENINFIASSGDCFMLLGMAPKYIEACVANHYETLARSIAEKEKHESHNHSDDLETHKFRFAHNYLEKMINIEITIPQMQPNSIDELLNPSVESHSAPWWQLIFNNSARSLSRALNIFIPVTFILFAIGTGWEYGRKIPDRPSPKPTPVHDLWSADQATLLSLASSNNSEIVTQRLIQKNGQAMVGNSTTNANGTYSIALQASQQQLIRGINLGSIGQGNNKANLLLRLNPETGKPVVQVDAEQATKSSSRENPDEIRQGLAAEFRQQSFESGSRISTLWLIFSMLMFISFTFYLYRKKTEKYAEDSDDFKAALSLWTPWIQLKQETPRAVKRFLNHLRFLAIRNHRKMHESLLVAMATIYFYNPEWLLDETKFKAIYEQDLFSLLKSDYRLDELDKEQQENSRVLLENLSQRLNTVLKEVNVDDLHSHREQAIGIFGGAMAIDQEKNENQKQKPSAQGTQMKI